MTRSRLIELAERLEPEDYMEREWRVTWMCSKCGGRHHVTENYCPLALEEPDDDHK